MLKASDIEPLPRGGNYVCDECGGRTMAADAAVRAIQNGHKLFPNDRATTALLVRKLERAGEAARAEALREWAGKKWPFNHAQLRR